MEYLISTHQQGTPAWLQARAGKATGSRAKDILAKIKNGEAAARRNYRVQLVTERLTGSPQESGFVSDAMKWGTEQEPFARMAYEAETAHIVQEAGFIYLTDINAGCSVDGLIGDDGMAEYKCPNSATHIEWMLAGEVPSEHKPQIIHNLWITGRQWCDFASFDPRLPENLQLFIRRYERNDEEIKAHESAVLEFLAEVDELENRLRKRAA